jgi:Spy/CpxP family protein refolding chaperone
MNRKLTILTLLVVTAMFLGVFQFSFAQGNMNLANKKGTKQGESFRYSTKEMKQLENNPNMKIKGLWESLNLSQEQKTELSKINLNFQKETLKFKNEIQLSQLEVKELFLEEELDLNRIRLELKKIADLEVETKIKGFEVYLTAKEILTPEQQEKLPKNMYLAILNFGRFNMAPRMNICFE